MNSVRHRSRGRRRKARGAAVAEIVIALPIIGLVLGCIIQIGLLFEAKAELAHATLQGARAGIANNANSATIQRNFTSDLLALNSPRPRADEFSKALSCDARRDATLNFCIRVLNPAFDAIDNLAPRDTKFGISVELPFNDLPTRSIEPGSQSGGGIQNVDFLKLRVVYGVPMKIPVVRSILAGSLRLLGSFDEFERRLLAQNRVPIVASARVRIPSTATINLPTVTTGFVLNPDALESVESCAQDAVANFLACKQVECLASTAISLGVDGAAPCMQ